jgi:ribosomal protein RSM22 (predicted rRNA methylase)
MESPDSLGAYLLYYWPHSYLQARWLIETAQRLCGAAPGPVVDIGAGPGPAAAAFADCGCSAAALVDSSPLALRAATSIVPGAKTFNARIREGPRDKSIREGMKEARFVYFGNCLNELDAPERAGAVKAWAGLTHPDALILIAEPALDALAREAMALRDELAAEGFRVLAPCPFQGPCPMRRDPKRSCHMAEPWLLPEPCASISRRAGLSRDAVKLAGYILAKPGSRAFESVARGLELAVSDPMLNKAGRLRFSLCGPEGLSTVSGKVGAMGPNEGAFSGIRRGDLVRFSRCEARESGRGVLPESEVAIVERLGYGARP